MKKLFLVLAAFSLLAVACSSNATVDTTAVVDAIEADDDNNGSSGSQGSTDSDDNDGAAGSAEPDTDTEDPPAPSEPTTAAAADPTPAAASTDGDTNEPDDDDGGDSLEDLPEFLADGDWCTAANFIEDNFDALDDVDFTNPQELEETYTRSLQLITQISAIAPPQIAGDVQTTIQGFGTFSAALEDVEWSFLDLDLSILDNLSDDMDLATYNIENYNFTVCGIGDNPGEPPVPANDGDSEDPGDGGDTTSPVPIEGTIREQAVAGLVAAGFTQEEAECIFAGMDVTDPEALSDTSGLLTLFTECGISLDRLAQLGG